MMVNASRNVLMSIANRSGRTFSYHGKGYTYHLHNTMKDIWAKLQIARKAMQGFMKAVGLGDGARHRLNSLEGIEVCEQGCGGWYEIFVLDERKLFAVINFIKKLNRFMNKNGEVCRVQKGHYFIETRRFDHTTPRHAPKTHFTKPITPIKFQPTPVRPPIATVANLERLALVVNRKYGH